MTSNQVCMMTGLVGLVGLLLAFPSAAATGGIVGTSTIPLAGCPRDGTTVVGRNAAGNSWRWDIGLGCASPKLVYLGIWDPATGGCSPDISGGTGQMCLGAVPTAGVPTTTSMEICYTADPTSCVAGSATIVRGSA